MGSNAMQPRHRLALALAVVALTAGCVEKLDPPELPDLPSAGDLAPLEAPLAIVSDGRITLDWPSALEPVLAYRLYRDAGEGSDEELLAEQAVTNWTDRDVVNGALYRYRVAAYYTAGIEGPRSERTSARPGLFSVTINEDQAATTDPAVRLSLGAPEGTAWMKLGATSDLTGIGWQPFAAASEWFLLGEDGDQWVFAEFRDALDNRSEQVADAIVLDRSAYIADFRFEVWPILEGEATKVLFFLLAGESGGAGWAEVESLADLPLFLGDSGDTLLGNWIVGEVTDSVQARVYGHYRDDLGNEALPFTAADLLILRP